MITMIVTQKGHVDFIDIHANFNQQILDLFPDKPASIKILSPFLSAFASPEEFLQKIRFIPPIGLQFYNQVVYYFLPIMLMNQQVG